MNRGNSQNNNRNIRINGGRLTSTQHPPQAPATNKQDIRGQLPTHNEDESLRAGGAPMGPLMNNVPASDERLRASTTHEAQNPMPSIYPHSLGNRNATHDRQLPMPPTARLSQNRIHENLGATNNYPVNNSPTLGRGQSYYVLPSNHTLVAVPSAVVMATANTVAHSSTTAAPVLSSSRETEINKKICEIILVIHKSNEYVSRERVEQELFTHFRVRGWTGLGVHPTQFPRLMELSDRQKGITFYMQIFEHIFNLCTLHDLSSLLERYVKVERYEDLQIGPLSENPQVRRLFKYQPATRDLPVPKITTGDIIKKFIEFRDTHHGHAKIDFQQFLTQLPQSFGLQKYEELGVFCGSLAFLKQVSSDVTRDYQWYMQNVLEDVQQKLKEDVRVRLTEIKEKLCNELEPSTLHAKRTPTAVFNHLTSIVDKHFCFIPQQSVLYTILVHLRDDELLRCLMNVAIYLGTTNQPETLIAELKKLYNVQENDSDPRKQVMAQEQLILNASISQKDRRKINSMRQHAQAQASNLMTSGQNTTTAPTSSASATPGRHRSKPKPPISFKELCAEIRTHLARYDTVLTLAQLLEVEKTICDDHRVDDFSVFTYDRNSHDDSDLVSFVAFVNTNRQAIDPYEELAIYEHATLRDDRTEILSFVQQLSVMNDARTNEEPQEHLPSLVENAEQFFLSEDKLATVEKVIKHKFGVSISVRERNQMVKKAKKRRHGMKKSIIRFEESLLDIPALNRLDLCPTSLNVDETQLCHLILRCPLMTDLYVWLQWPSFFQPKYGDLKTFISERAQQFKDLYLLETSTGELFPLPIDVHLTTFEHELDTMQIRSAVGHLCALIIQEDLIARFSFNIYRISMTTWFRKLQSLALLQKDHLDPVKYILDFLICLPVLVGQSRIVEELILGPLDEVFGNERENGINARARIWNQANEKEKAKLELWSYVLDVSEWKNENKWLGVVDVEEKPTMKSESQSIQKENTIRVVPVSSIPTLTPVSTRSIIIDPASTTRTTSATTDNDETAVSSADAFEHIESIRRLFGVKTDFDPTNDPIIANYRACLEGLLGIVSTGLYSDQSHFVLELIQNADDNDYTDSLPTLRFTLSPERILVFNNEIGFQHKNVKAICNVCASTKEKHKKGYVGHKGIGFKSVFIISHRPEIHSGNYHFCFDTFGGTEPMGDMQPIWLDSYEEVLPDPNQWMTCIRLPIKPEIQRDRLQRDFDEVQSRFLLFLNRLRQIEIVNEAASSSTSHPTRIFTRIDHAGGQIIELQEKTTNGSTTSSLWLIIEKDVEITDDIRMKLTEKKSSDDLTTRIAIAYPLNALLDSTAPLPSSQPLFAYLPLRSYRFRFILQGDFEVPANRKEVLHDHVWNDWLKSEMTCLLSLTYEKLQHVPDLLSSLSIGTQTNDRITPIQVIKYFLKLLPSRDDIDPYFTTFVDKSIQPLMGTIQLPISRQNENNETIVDWVSPSKCVLVRDPFIRKILSQDLLLSHFNSYYVHEELIRECDEQILVKLGCRLLDLSDIIQLIEMSYKQDEQLHPKTPLAIEQVAQWLVCLDYSLQQQREETNYEKREKEILTKLKLLKIIPLKTQTHLVSIDEFDKQTISFPLDKSIQFSKYLKTVLDDVPTLDQQLLNFIEDKYPRRYESIRKLLRKLGITESPNVRDIYRQHILPVMSDSNRWSFKSESVLIAYLLCIYKDLYLPDTSTFENELLHLQTKMVIKTRDGKFVSLGSPDVTVHLTSRYEVAMSLESLKSATSKFTFISDDYYNQWYAEMTSRGRRKDNMDSINNLTRFLQGLNIDAFLRINSDTKSFLSVSELAGTQWEYLNASLKDMIHESFQIQDYRCDEFVKLVSSSEDKPTADPELCAQLLQYMHNCHDHVSMFAYYAASISLIRAHKYGHSAIKAIVSSFCLSVRKHAWIPVDGNQLSKPSDAYLLLPNSETFAFRRYVPHVDLSKLTLSNQDFIYNILGIKSEITPRTMFELLMKWSCDLDSKALRALVEQAAALDIIPCTLPSTFRRSYSDSIDSVRQIYQFLACNNETRSLLGRFRSWPIIFRPRDQRNGDFLFTRETFWNDPIALLSSQDTVTDSKGRIPIRNYYDDHSVSEKLFLEVLQVEFQPTTDDYLPLLSTMEDTEKIWQIIEIITKLATEQNQEEEVREKCLDLAFIPCMGSTSNLMKYTDQPFYPDDAAVASLFVDTLPIIKLPSSNITIAMRDQFCSLFQIQNLKEVIHIKVTAENEQPSASLSNFYRSSIDLIQTMLIKYALISATQNTRLASVFSRMQFVCAELISLSYCYGSNVIKSAPTSYGKDSYIDEQSAKFYIRKKFETSETRYIDTMVEFLVEDEGARSELSRYIKKLLQAYQTDEEHGLAKLREQLTENYEPKWTIPEEIQTPTPVEISVLEKEGEEEEERVFERPQVTQAEIDAMAEKEYSGRERRSKNKPTPETDSEIKSIRGENTPTRSNRTSSTKPELLDTTEGKPKSSTGHDPTHRTSEDESSNRQNRHTDGERRDERSNGDDHVVPARPLTNFTDSQSAPPINVERIPISTLADLDLSTSTDGSSMNTLFQSLNSDDDLVTGRTGEEIVFRRLKKEHPNEDIQWLNEKEELGGPYDICLTYTSDHDRKEFIEVKSTRSCDQNTFPISISEVEYLLRHPSNYYIYRLYYSANQDFLEILKINRVKDKLLKKRLKLGMTIVPNTSD